jgi:membrane-associated phospholipid phosphatase
MNVILLCNKVEKKHVISNGCKKSSPVEIKMNRIIFISICLIIFTSFLNVAHSEENPPEPSSHTLKSVFRTDAHLIYQNGIDLILSPLHAKTSDWIITASLIGATAASLALDSKVRDLAQSHQSKRNDNVFWFGHVYGSGITAVGVGAGLYSAGLVFSEDWTRETGREILTATGLAGLTTGILKAGIGRSRPFVKNGPFSLHPFKFSNEYYSFPSGHTTTAFAISTVLATRINNPYASVGFYALALLTASQRMYSDNHWLSDCVLGAAIGTAVGRFISMDSNRIIKTKTIKISLIPVTGFSSAGIALDMNF